MDHIARCVMPQLGMPQLGNLIINIKDTSVLNVISVTELYFASKSAAGVYYKYFEIFLHYLRNLLYYDLYRFPPAALVGKQDGWT